MKKGEYSMNKAQNRFERLNEKRMLSLDEAAFYTGLGRTSCRQWLDKIGAVKKIGKRVLCDRVLIDRALGKETA